MKTIRVLVVLHENFEELEAIAPIDLLRRTRIEVTIASAEPYLRVKGRSGIVVEAEKLLSTICDEIFDCIVLPGGPGIQKLRSNQAVLNLVEQQAKAKRWIAGICAAPLILSDLNLLQNHPFTAHSSTLETLKAPFHQEEVIISQPFITSKGPGTAIEFSLCIIRELLGKEAMKKVIDVIEYMPRS